MQAIIFNNENKYPSVFFPSQEALGKYSMLDIAKRVVPAGKPFAIVDAADLPDAPQETWVVDDADLTDGIGGESHEFG